MVSGHISGWQREPAECCSCVLPRCSCWLWLPVGAQPGPQRCNCLLEQWWLVRVLQTVQAHTTACCCSWQQHPDPILNIQPCARARAAPTHLRDGQKPGWRVGLPAAAEKGAQAQEPAARAQRGAGLPGGSGHLRGCMGANQATAQVHRQGSTRPTCVLACAPNGSSETKSDETEVSQVANRLQWRKAAAACDCPWLAEQRV